MSSPHALSSAHQRWGSAPPVHELRCCANLADDSTSAGQHAASAPPDDRPTRAALAAAGACFGDRAAGACFGRDAKNGAGLGRAPSVPELMGVSPIFADRVLPPGQAGCGEVEHADMAAQVRCCLFLHNPRSALQCACTAFHVYKTSCQWSKVCLLPSCPLESLIRPLRGTAQGCSALVLLVIHLIKCWCRARQQKLARKSAVRLQTSEGLAGEPSGGSSEATPNFSRLCCPAARQPRPKRRPKMAL